MNNIKTSIKRLFLFSFLLLNTGILQATHVAGGTMTYRCLGNDRYEISMEFRRDCINGDEAAPFDDPATFGVYDSNFNLMTFSVEINDVPGVEFAGRFQIPLTTNDTLIETLTTECNVISGDVCIQTTLYRDTIRLPYVPGGYNIVYQRCCRNISLNNIMDPLDTGATYWINLTEDALTACNTSPVWNDWPDIYICASDTLNYSHSATDADGDSLVYSLCTPSNGLQRDPNIWTAPPTKLTLGEVLWANGYDIDNLFGGGDPLTIDPHTGLMHAIPPPIISQFLVGVCVKEYRDGVLLSTIRRDFEYNIRTCGRAPVASANPDSFQKCNSLDVSFTNETTSNFKPTDSLDYTWIFDYPAGTLTSTEMNPSVSYPRSGVYDVILVADDGTCVDTVFLQVAVATEEDPSISFDYSVVNCNPNNTLYLTANHSITAPLDSLDYRWIIVADGITEEIFGPMPVYDIGTASEVIVTLGITGPTGCESIATSSEEITSEQNPIINFSLDSYNCNSTTSIELISDIITTDIVTPDSIVWTIFANGSENIIRGSNPTYDIINDQQITVTLEVTTDEGCYDSITETYDIVTEPDPVVSFTYFATNCNNSSLVAFIGSASSATQNIDPNSYEWTLTTFNNTVFNGTGINYRQDIGVDQPLTVELKVSTLEGCTTTYTEGIQIITLPFNPVFNNSIVCPGETGLIYSNSNPSNTVTISPTPANLVVDTNGNHLVPNLQNSTSYDVTVSNADCSKTESVTITVDSNPSFAEIPDLVQCGDNSVLLNPSGVSSYVYQWAGPSGVAFDMNAVNPLVSLPNDGTFYVTISTSAASNCFGFDTMEVNRVELPTISFTPDRELIYCENTSITVTATSNGTLTWSENGVVFQGGNEITISDLQESVIYEVESVNDDGCSMTDQLEIQFIPAPIIEVDPITPQNACFGEDLTATIITDDLVSWQTESGEVLGTGNSFTIAEIYQDTSLVIIVENDLGCTAEQTVSFSVYDLPAVDPALNERNICTGVPLELISNLTDYTIKVYNTMDEVISTEHVTAITEGLTSSTSFIYEYTTMNGCVDFDTIFINVFDEVGLDINAGATEQVYCRGFIPVVSATTNVDANIEWLVDNQVVANGPSIINYLPNGDEVIIAVATTNDGCTQADTLALRQDFAEGAITGDDVICIGENTTLSYTPNQATDYTISWTPEDAIDSVGTSIIVSPDLTTVYTATYTNNNGCRDTTDYEVTVGGFESAPTTTASTPEICRTQSTELFIDTDPDNSFNWTPATGLDDPTKQDPIATPDETTTYTVNVVDQYGCTTSNSIEVRVIQPTCDENDVFIPNMFTPNFDDLNDTFKVESAFLESMNLVIYDRWGEQVYISDEQSEGWDGTYKGNSLAPDVYGYHFTGVCVNGFTVQMQGNVTLIK